MALPATLVWEIRPTNGTTNAGGGFDPSVASPGTDYSQQNAVQVAYTDLVIDGTTNTDITSAASPFVATDIGNNIAITGGTGFTTGIYNIRSIPSGNIARLDRAVGTLSSTGGTGNLGGARSGFSVGTTTLQASLVAGNIVHVKNEAWNEAVTLTVAGAAATPIKIVGYNATRGDISLGDGNANNPTNNRASAAGDGVAVNAAGYMIYNINVSNAGDDGFAQTFTGNCMYVNCKSSSNGGNGIHRVTGSASIIVMVGCEISSNTGFGAGINGNAGTVDAYGCNIHDNTGIGIQGPVKVMFCIVETNSSHGFNLQTVSAAHGPYLSNTIYGNSGATTDGISAMGTPTNQFFVLNNIIASNGRYGVNATDGDSVVADFNDYNGNGTAARNNFPTGDSDSTADPGFTDAAGGNFAIGTNLKALGFPGAFPAGLSTGYLDIGAVQRQEPAGASGGKGRASYAWGQM